MKKVILSVVVVALATVVFTSCKDDPTKEELLTDKKGWKLSSAVTNPAYTNSKGVTSVDLLECWFAACELKDVLYFKTDKATSLTSGCDGTKETTGTWEFLKDETQLRFRLHYFEDDTPVYDVVTIKELSEDTFKYDFTWKDDDGVHYTFTLTYVHK